MLVRLFGLRLDPNPRRGLFLATSLCGEVVKLLDLPTFFFFFFVFRVFSLIMILVFRRTKEDLRFDNLKRIHRLK